MRSGFWFLLVGATASLTHLSVYYASTQWLLAINELANAIAFAIAFFVSFTGHRLLSFKGSGTSVQQSLLRFFITALAGFFTNELVFVLLFRLMGLNDWAALLIAIASAAAQTFVLSKFWAFRKA
jgi:putative flippase GtrA